MYHVLMHEGYGQYINVTFEMGIDWHDTHVIEVFFFLIFVFELQAQNHSSYIKTEI
jgi:hypothetical protein